MRATVTTRLPASAHDVWSLVRESRTLVYVTKGLLGFSGSNEFPPQWREGDTQSTRLLFFGVIPAWKHRIHFRKVSDSERVLDTHEEGGIVSTWDHTIKVEPINEHTCHYTDEIDIKAGWATPLIWMYANLLYRYRQYRWARLIEQRVAQQPKAQR